MQGTDGLREVRHVSVSINRMPADVYAFASGAENIPKWAKGLCETIRKDGDAWIGEGGSLGRVKIRFTAFNSLGVLDHEVELSTGIRVLNPIRVLPNGSGSELTFTLFRQPDKSAAEFAEDAAAVERDLRTLETLLEQAPRGV